MDERSKWVLTQLAVGLIFFIIFSLGSFLINVFNAIYDTIIEFINGVENAPADTNEERKEQVEVDICLKGRNAYSVSSFFNL